MRYLSFEKDKDEKKYKTLYDGIMASSRGFTDLETRVISNVLNKLEAIGTPSDEGDGAFFALTKTGEVALEDAEFKLMMEAYKKVTWTARGSRDAADVREWLEAAPTEKAVLEGPRLHE